MNKILLEKNGDYTLFNLIDNKCTPYVVAWKYDNKSDSWCQGHYFSDYINAIEYLRKGGK